MSGQGWQPHIFRYRAFLFGLALWGAFGFYLIDQVPLSARISDRFNGGTTGIQAGLFLGTILAASGFLIRFYGTGYLSAATVRSSRVKTHRLVMSGPYARTRNPLYFGNLLLAFGFGMAVPFAGFTWIVTLNLVLIILLVIVEEDRLHTALGDTYREYKKRVPRFLPKFRTKQSTGPGVEPVWRDGLLGEGWLASIPVSMLVFAFTLNWQLFALVLGGTFFAGFIGLLFYVSRDKPRAEDAPAHEDESRGFGFEA